MRKSKPGKDKLLTINMEDCFEQTALDAFKELNKLPISSVLINYLNGQNFTSEC